MIISPNTNIKLVDSSAEDNKCRTDMIGELVASKTPVMLAGAVFLVVEAGDTIAFKSKDNIEFKKRVITVTDNSCSMMDLVLWGSHAAQSFIPAGEEQERGQGLDGAEKPRAFQYSLVSFERRFPDV